MNLLRDTLWPEVAALITLLVLVSIFGPTLWLLAIAVLLAAIGARRTQIAWRQRGTKGAWHNDNHGESTTANRAQEAFLRYDTESGGYRVPPRPR